MKVKSARKARKTNAPPAPLAPGGAKLVAPVGTPVPLAPNWEEIEGAWERVIDELAELGARIAALEERMARSQAQQSTSEARSR